MSSSRERLSSASSDIQKPKSFTTVIHPHQDKIHIPENFIDDWKNHLTKPQRCWVMDHKQNHHPVELVITNAKSYINSGKVLAWAFGFKEPTSVHFQYHPNDNEFTITLIQPQHEEVIIISSDDEETVNFESLSDDSNSESDSDDSDNNDNEDLFNWETNVTEAMASLQKSQVMSIPRKIANTTLLWTKEIQLQTPYDNNTIQLSVVTSRRTKNKLPVEKYFTEGWYEFVRKYQPKFGDTLKFQLSDPPEVVFVEIIRI